MTFIANGSSVFWCSAGGGPYEMKGAQEIDALLAIFQRAEDRKAWLALDQAAQDAGYPGSVPVFALNGEPLPVVRRVA